jgi:hypothetical protein
MAHGVESDGRDHARALVPWGRRRPYLSEWQLGTTRGNIGLGTDEELTR